MLNFETLNGFYVDLTTEPIILIELESVLSDEEDRKLLVKMSTTDDLRQFILEYYTSYYDYVFCRKPNLYFIVDDELITERDAKQRERNLKFSNNILVTKLDNAQQLNNDLINENATLLKKIRTKEIF